MKISQIIKQLEDIKNKEGDLELFSEWQSGGHGYPDISYPIESLKIQTAWSVDECLCPVQWNEKSEQKKVIVLGKS